LEELSDEQLLQEVALGRSRGIYLLGHLSALIDHSLILFGARTELKNPVYASLFVRTPDKASELPPVSEVRKEWNEQKIVLQNYIASTSTEQWFERHTSISAENFEKEPHRNKLNVLLSRATHLDYHMGQMVFLKGM
jgi:DinB superfamily